MGETYLTYYYSALSLSRRAFRPISSVTCVSYPFLYKGTLKETKRNHHFKFYKLDPCYTTKDRVVRTHISKMGKTKLPVGLPSPTPTQAYWQTPPHPIATHRTTPALPKTTTYAIVGSGVSGALIAYKLLEAQPTASITILEARTTCSGATGRNGGHCRAGRYLSFADDLATFGEDEALRMEKLEEDNVKLVGELIRSLRIDCDLRDVETLDVTTDEAQWEAVLKALEERKRVLSGKVAESVLTKHRIWSKEETRNELLIPEGVGAVSFPAFKLSPYKFVCGLLELCIARGLNLQTNTPVLEVSQLSTRRGEKWWQVHTDRGSISAKNVILATNAYTPFLYPPLSNFIIPTRGQVAAIRPGSNISGNPALQRTMGLNSAVADDYMQARSEGTTGAGDLIIGKKEYGLLCRHLLTRYRRWTKSWDSW